MKTTRLFFCGHLNKARRISRVLFVGTPALCLACLAALAQTNDARGPIPVSASSPDGWIIGVCFDKPLSEASATNVANYTLSDSRYRVASAMLRPDLQSVTLRLARQYPLRVAQFWVTNLAGIDGRSTPWTDYVYFSDFTATDVGNMGADPIEPGNFFTCREGEFMMVSTGSGWEAMRDGFYFVHTPIGPALEALYVWKVSSLEAANKDSSVGMMIREDLTPGSRFLSVSVTPTDAAARDGSGAGSALVKVLYREQPGSIASEISGTRSIKGLALTNLSFSIFRSRERVNLSWANRPGGNYEVLAEVSFPEPITESWRIGLAAASHNNDTRFSNRSISSLGKVHGDPLGEFQVADPFPPPVQITRAGNDVILSWTETNGPSYVLVSKVKLTNESSWDTLTNEVVRVSGPVNVTNLVTVRSAGESRFFTVRR